MAYTNSPENQTYKTVQIKFDGETSYRSGDLSLNRDLQIWNMYYDRISQENEQRIVRLMKRDGIGLTTWSLNKTSSSDAIRGYFNDRDTNTFYWAVNDKVYSLSPDVSNTVRTVTTLGTSSGTVGFVDYRAALTSTRYIIFSDGIDLWLDDYLITTCTAVNVGTDPDFPSPHQPYPVTINGYVFLLKTNTPDIYNSDNDAPAAWTAGSIASAEIAADRGIRLFRIKNYVVCFGTTSIEYFWDAAATPSPLSRYDSPIRNIGYVSGGIGTEDAVYFVGQDDKQNIGVYEVKDFKATKISTSVVDRTLQTSTNTQNDKSKAVLNVDGCILSSKGHTFYVVRLDTTTWVYDLNERMWYEWKGSDGTGLKIEATWAAFNSGMYCAVANQNYICLMSQGYYQDFGTNFTCRYTTEDNDFGTMNWKVAHRTSLKCSMHNYTGTSNINIKWSDNDWADGGTIPNRNINVFSSSPFISSGGKFRNRTFRLEYTDNYPFFMSGLEIDLNVYGV